MNIWFATVLGLTDFFWNVTLSFLAFYYNLLVVVLKFDFSCFVDSFVDSFSLDMLFSFSFNFDCNL